MDERQLTRHQRRKQRTRNLLKSVAAELLIEKGYDALTVQDITDRADLARGTFYVHFKDKEEAVWAILYDSFEELTAALYDGLPDDPVQMRYAKWVRLFTYVDDHRDLLAVLMGERGHITLYRRMADYMAHIIERDMTSGVIDRITDQPIAFVAQYFAGAVMQSMTWWLAQPPGQITPEGISAMVFALILRDTPPGS